MVKEIKNRSTKILAIESSGKSFSATLAEGEVNLKILADISFDIGFKHSSIMKESCQTILKLAGIDLHSLTHLAVSTGPGSFTGIRVGVSFIRALASTLKIPLIGIPTFEILAKRVEERNLPTTVLIDSIGEDLFMGQFNPGDVTPERPYSIIKLSQLLKKLRPDHLYIGEGYLRYEKVISSHLIGAKEPLPREVHFPRSKECAILAWEKIRAKKYSNKSWENVVPFYLRPPLVVERLKNHA